MCIALSNLEGGRIGIAAQAIGIARGVRRGQPPTPKYEGTSEVQKMLIARSL